MVVLLLFLNLFFEKNNTYSLQKTWKMQKMYIQETKITLNPITQRKKY